MSHTTDGVYFKGQLRVGVRRRVACLAGRRVINECEPEGGGEDGCMATCF